jgi:CRP/FNR family transcriptional regulator
MFLSPAAQATVCASKSTDAPAVDVFASASGLSEAPGYAARLIGKYCSAVKLRFRRGSLIFAEGATAQYLYLLQVGAARCYKQLPDGRREIIGFALPGDLFGTGAVKVYPHSAEAINATTILRYEWSALAPAAASNGRLARCLLADAYRQLSAAQSQLLLLGRKSAAERVASFLLELLERKTGNGAKPTVIDLPMTRNDIADYLGLTTETVSRVLGQLKTEGVIELPNTKMAIVRDVDRVRTLAAGEVTRISRRQNGHALSWQGVTRP